MKKRKDTIPPLSPPAVYRSLRKSFMAVSAWMLLCACVLGLFTSTRVQAQITNVVFLENFDSGTIDPEKFQPDAPFFEGGTGDFQVSASGGMLHFTGIVNEQWWPGTTLRVVPTFTASEEQSVAVSVDRVSELGVGTASRSALWIMDSTQTRYVLFADVRGEGGWRFNRKIGEPGDVPTGSGTNMGPLDGGNFDDGGFHQMRAVANGQTVRLFVDDVLGAEVRFPFSELVFHLGTYARAVNDLADTIFDNLKVETIGHATFALANLTLQTGQTASEITVRIPPGANATEPVNLQILSSNPAVAIPTGAINGSLTLTFEAGGPNTRTIDVQSVGGIGGAQLTLQSDIGLTGGNRLSVTVIEGPGVRLTEDFSGAAIDTAKWQISERPFEAGDGSFQVQQTGGVLEISGVTLGDFWPGASLKTAGRFTATKDLPLIVEVDRISINPAPFGVPSTAARTGVFLTADDRTRYVFFGQNVGETGWSVNVNPGNPTGSGTAIAAFAGMSDLGSHRIRMVADGEGVEVFLDGIRGGRFDFPVNSEIHVELGTYARAMNDEVTGVFDNVQIANALPCVQVSPADFFGIAGQQGIPVTVTIPRLSNTTEAAQVTITSQDPSIAFPEGGANGSLTLNFPAASTNAQTFNIISVGVGATSFQIVAEAGICVDGSLAVTVTPPPVELMSDSFASQIDPARWSTDLIPLGEAGLLTEASGAAIANGEAVLTAIAEVSGWPGLALRTVETFEADITSPVLFEIDRVKLGFQLVTGTGAKQRTGIWITDSARSQYVFFGEYATHDGVAGGWQFNRLIGQPGDNPLPAGGTTIQAFTAARFNDFGNHRLRAVANGATVKLYLDDVFGAEVPFPVSTGIVFGFATYVNDAGNSAVGTFDNAVVLGSGDAPPVGERLSINRDAANIVVSWTGSGTLQSATALGEGAVWTDVTPAPTGNSYSVPVTAGEPQLFFRLRQ
jgi:hypothetical protein